MNTFKGACFQEVTHDEVYYVNRTTDGRFLADIIFSVLCPRDCSGNGNCTNGNFMERKREDSCKSIAEAINEDIDNCNEYNYLHNYKLYY